MCVAHMHILCRLVLHGFEGHVIRTSGIKSVFSLGAMGLLSALGLNHKFLLNLGRFFFPPKISIFPRPLPYYAWSWAFY